MKLIKCLNRPKSLTCVRAGCAAAVSPRRSLQRVPRPAALQAVPCSAAARPALAAPGPASRCGQPTLGAPRSVVQFKEVFLTPEYLAIAMEYAAGGDMFQYVKQRGGLEEAEARWFFQQLIIGMDYCHKMARAPGCLLLAGL